MSSSENTPTGGSDEPTAEDLAASPGAQAEIERTASDPGVDTGAAVPGGDPGASERGPVPAPGAPGELSSDADDDPTTGAAPSPRPLPADEGSPESAGAGAPAADGGAAAAASEPSSLVPDQPEPTPSAAADASVGKQADAARADKAAQAEAAAQAGKAGAAPASPSADVAPGSAAGEAVQPHDEPEPETEPEEIDERRQPLLDLLRERLGDDVVATHVLPGIDVWVRVHRQAWRRAAEICRDELGLTYFCHLSAIDWMPSPYGKSEDGGLGADPVVPTTVPSDELEHGYTGGETRFQLLARLQSPTTGLGIHLKTDVPDDDLVVETWTTLFAGADWHERETAEMFGIGFAGHPNLTKLYLPGSFEGFPLRKDFPLLARDVKPWPGLVDVEPLPGEDAPEPAEAQADA